MILIEFLLLSESIPIASPSISRCLAQLASWRRWGNRKKQRGSEQGQKVTPVTTIIQHTLNYFPSLQPRDQFLARLMKKLKVDPGKSNASPSEDKNEDVEESWEDLDSGSDEDDQVRQGAHLPDTSCSLFLRMIWMIFQASRVPAAKRHTRGPSSHALKSLMLRNKESAMFKKLLPCRQELPVFQHQQEILELIHQQNVVVIAGETGSGKSTQIPQFILEVSFLKWDIFFSWF